MTKEQLTGRVNVRYCDSMYYLVLQVEVEVTTTTTRGNTEAGIDEIVNTHTEFRDAEVEDLLELKLDSSLIHPKVNMAIPSEPLHRQMR